MSPAVQKAPKKRPAKTQAGPSAKKPHLEKASEAKAKKRSRPITSSLPEDSADTSDEDEHDEESFEEEVEGEDMDAEMDIEENTKDPNAARESHKEQRAILAQRKAAKPHSALLTDAKRAWTLARQKSLSKKERTKHINALMDIIRGKVKDIVFKHDASRIVQTVVKYGGQKERNEIAEELKGKYRELAQSKYSKFLVTKLIRFCPTYRAIILREFQGHVLKLLLHREASGVLSDAFELYANAYERSILLRDFYGKEASLFTVTAGSSEEQERSKRGLKGLMEGLEGERRKRVLSALKDNLVTIYNNPDKGAVVHTIVHRALWEYLSAIAEIEDEAEAEKLRREMFETCQDVLAEMVHTRDGSRAVREFIAWGTAKDRKHIVKAIKPHIERICKDDEAQLVLFSALDIIDDTKLTAKSLVSDVVAAASTLYTSSQGRRSLFYLVAPRTRRHFTPAQIATLAETDAIRAKTSKKDDELRTSEIRKAASEGLLNWVAQSGAEVSRDPGGSLVVCEIMLDADGDKTSAMEALLNALCAPYPSSDPVTPHPISLPHTSRIYKTLLQGGHFSHATKSIEQAPRFSAREFATRFVQVVGRDSTVAMAQGDGAFVVAALCEQLAEHGDVEERKTVKGWFDAKTRKAVEAAGPKGVSVLLESLKKL
ncbi:ARM repeat-containing protein [Lentinus tigrinus ALCF2SS1-7]|uniref:ARM repeat-containing protein n=1 Tax=Lentinus tigrinus ALCF2SS1-6 TaxID=1328759 RepID=A0A5C2SV85_9APHY|nr:ARM repeat-containing protein [Lentinus tigrinus ALCF2SS1-6]RPD79417.1 ARM repeat-containing protein [Lentinus tigrinus ALCF2SS1-7]